jgi:hypothetical protein
MEKMLKTSGNQSAIILVEQDGCWMESTCWGDFLLDESAGKQIGQVDPYNTSQVSWFS